MNHNLFIFAGRCISNYWFPLRTFSRFFSESYYDVLKVSPTCTTKEIREAFLVLSKKTHPDKHLNDPSMHEKFVRLNEAYSTLINPSSRRAYDLSLYNERKLNPPYGKYGPYSQMYTSRRTPYDTYHSTKRSQSTNDGYYKNPFSWDYKNKTDNNHEQNFPYGIRGVKKLSNTAIVGCLLTITVVGAIIQLLAIRHSFLISQEKMLERSHHYSMIHKLAQEKAKLYGNAHQIEVLKRKTAGFFDEDSIDSAILNENTVNDTTEHVISIKESMNNITEGKSPILSNDGHIIGIEESMNNFSEGKGPMLVPSNDGHCKSQGAKTGICAIHGSPGHCAVHKKSIDLYPKTPAETRTVTSPVDACTKCKKCGHQIN